MDGDGVDGVAAGGTDCDDAAAAIRPGTEEVPYDGVDQDCDGTDLDDVDGDGSIAVEAGGADCDDTNAAIFAGGDETWANGFTDNDCDGDPGDATLEYGAQAWSGARADDYLGRRLAALGDTDGDGAPEVLVGSEFDSTVGDGSGAVYAVDGPPTGGIADGRGLWPEVGGMYFASDLDAGVDATGDGVPDVVVSTVGSAEEAGTAWLVDGADWAVAGDALVGDVSRAQVRGSAAGTYGPTAVRFVGDVDGDGVTDIALSECCGTAAGTSSLGRVAIVSAADFEGSIEDARVMVDGPWEGAYMGGEIDPIGDQDGDGLDDLVLSGTYGLAAAVVPGNRSGSAIDTAISMIYGNVSEGYANARNAGDLDGDGADDIAVLGERAEGVIYLFTAVGASPSRVLDSPSCLIDWTEHGGVMDVVPLGDRDGDGRDELFVPQYFSDSGNQRAWIVPGSVVNFGDVVQPETLPLQALSVVPTAGFGYAAAVVGDVDGDGREDIALGAPDYSASAAYAGGATLIPIPE